jgi:hypothetical protein
MIIKTILTSSAFKGDCKKLSDKEQQEKEVVMLNPKQAPSNTGRNPCGSSAAQLAKSGSNTEDLEKMQKILKEKIRIHLIVYILVSIICT